MCWYGQQDGAWVAYYDILHRLGLASYRQDDLDGVRYRDGWRPLTA